MSRWSDRWDLKQAGLGNLMLSHTLNKQFMSAITKAERDYGKSMYNLQSVAYVFYHLGYGEEEAWLKALDCFVFTPEQLRDRIKEARQRDEIIPFVVIDDAAVHFSNKQWFINMYSSMLIDALFDTIREAVRILLINCPSKKRLQGSLQGYDDYEITIYKAEGGGYQRRSVCIKWYSLPDGHRKYRKIFDDSFSCYVPDWVYAKYRPIRRKYIDYITEKLDDLSKDYQMRKHNMGGG